MRVILVFIAVVLSSSVASQESIKWGLTDCIEYAISNNIEVKRTELNQETAKVNLHQAKNNRLPSVQGNTGANLNNGSVINQITNARISQTAVTNSFGLNASVSLYNGNELNNRILRNKLSLEQNELYVQEAQNNIRLSVLEAYLQVLFQHEAIIVAENTAASSEEELKQARKRYELGSIAKLELAEMETLHANNQYNIISARNQYDAQLLVLKQLLELDPYTDFEIEIPNTDDFTGIVPNKEEVFHEAVNTLPDLKIYDIQNDILKKDIQIAKAGYLPSLALSVGVNTGFSSLMNYNYKTQLENNFGQTVGLSLTIPIFSRYQNKNNVKLAQISLQQNDLDRIEARKALYAKIETAWQNATTRQAQQMASKIARDNAKIAYELASKKYEFGGLTNTELAVSRNTYLNAEQTYLQNKYMATLYLQLLNFYQGKDISIN